MLSRHSGTVLLAALSMLTSMAAGGALARPSTAPPAVERGEQLVQLNCGRCHSTGRRGLSPNPHSPPLRTLHRFCPIGALGESMSEGLLRAHPGMPSFNFTRQDASDIIAYLETIQRGRSHAPQGPCRPPPHRR